MKIETKFDIGQEVYVIYFDWVSEKIYVTNAIIEDINILPYTVNSQVCYNYHTSIGEYEENDIYITREEAEQKLKEIGEIV